MLANTPPAPEPLDQTPALEAKGLGYAIDSRALIGSVDVTFPTGQVSALVGHNGSGKSTLLKLLAGQLQAGVGEIRIAGRALHGWNRRELARRIAYLPQHTADANGLTVGELVAHGRYPWHGALGRFRDADRAKVDEAMRLTGVAAFVDRAVDTLSGGERQRVWLAMLVAQDASILLLDEPISALDIAHQVEVLSLIRDLGRLRNASTVVVLHDINMAARYADRIVALKNGRLIAAGSPEEIMEAGTLEAIFGVRMTLIRNPETGRPIAHVA